MFGALNSSEAAPGGCQLATRQLLTLWLRVSRRMQPARRGVRPTRAHRQKEAAHRYRRRSRRTSGRPTRAEAGEQEEGTRRAIRRRSHPSFPAEPSRASHPNRPDGLCPDVVAVAIDSAECGRDQRGSSPFADPDGSAETTLGAQHSAELRGQVLDNQKHGIVFGRVLRRGPGGRESPSCIRGPLQTMAPANSTSRLGGPMPFLLAPRLRQKPSAGINGHSVFGVLNPSWAVRPVDISRRRGGASHRGPGLTQCCPLSCGVRAISIRHIRKLQFVDNKILTPCAPAVLRDNVIEDRQCLLSGPIPRGVRSRVFGSMS